MSTLKGLVKLALSLSGGSSGERQMPLVTTEESWTVLNRRCRELASSEVPATVTALLDVLTNALSAEGAPPSSNARVEAILRSVCEVAVNRWDERAEPLALDALKSFHRACEALKTAPPFPKMESTWEAATEEVRDDLKTGQVPDSLRLTRWLDLVDLIEKYYPALAEKDAFGHARSHVEGALFEIATEVIARGIDLEDPDFNESHGRSLEQFAECLSLLDRDGRQDHIVTDVYGLAQEYKEHGPHEEGPDYEPEGRNGSADTFDIEGLFEDL